MNRILLVARRDFLQIVATRAFKITLLIVPVMLGISVLATALLRPPATIAYVMADAGGAAAPLIARRVALDYRRRLSLRAGAKPAPPPYIRVAVPKDVPRDQGAEAFGHAIAPYLGKDAATPLGKRPLGLAVYIPVHGPARLWTDSRGADGLVDIIAQERTRLLRIAALRAEGVADAARIETLEAPLAVAAAPAGGGRAQMTVRSLVPLMLVYLLLMSALITGGMMLQGVIEERSNRLLEAVLACVEPRELMIGKLIGLGGVGLTILAAWVGCALLATFSIQGAAADYLRPALAALNQPWMIPLMAFYFFCGYLILAMIYLTIGSLSNSMQDAQAYLMPVTMAVLLPVMLMVSSVFQNPGGWLPRVMSWIPVYTPFAMLARLGTGVTAAEIAGTGLLLVGFVSLELILLGRVFRASLLHSGQPPRLGGFVRLMLRRD